MEKEKDAGEVSSGENIRQKTPLKVKISTNRSTRMKEQNVFIGHHINKWQEMMESLDLTSVSLANHLFEVHDRHCSYCLYYRDDDESRKRKKRRGSNEPIMISEHMINNTDFSHLAERNSDGQQYQMYITPQGAEKESLSSSVEKSSSRRKPAVTERIPQTKEGDSAVKSEPDWEDAEYGSSLSEKGQVSHADNVDAKQTSTMPAAVTENEGEIKNPTFIHAFGENFDMPSVVDYESTIKSNIAMAIEMANNGTSPITKGAIQKRAYRDRVKQDEAKWQRQKEKAAQRMRERREKLKRDTDRYKEYCAIGAERARKYRQNMTEEEKNRVKEKNRDRARQRRQKQRLECELQKFYYNLIQQQKDRIKARIASGETQSSSTDLLDEHGLQLEGDLQEQYNQMIQIYQQKLASEMINIDDDDNDDDSKNDSSLNMSFDNNANMSLNKGAKEEEKDSQSNDKTDDKYAGQSELSTGSSEFDVEDQEHGPSKYFNKASSEMDNQRHFLKIASEREKLYKQLPGMSSFSFRRNELENYSQHFEKSSENSSADTETHSEMPKTTFSNYLSDELEAKVSQAVGQAFKSDSDEKQSDNSSVHSSANTSYTSARKSENIVSQSNNSMNYLSSRHSENSGEHSNDKMRNLAKRFGEHSGEHDSMGYLAARRNEASAIRTNDTIGYHSARPADSSAVRSSDSISYHHAKQNETSVVRTNDTTGYHSARPSEASAVRSSDMTGYHIAKQPENLTVRSSATTSYLGARQAESSVRSSDYMGYIGSRQAENLAVRPNDNIGYLGARQAENSAVRLSDNLGYYGARQADNSAIKSNTGNTEIDYRLPLEMTNRNSEAQPRPNLNISRFQPL